MIRFEHTDAGWIVIVGDFVPTLLLEPQDGPTEAADELGFAVSEALDVLAVAIPGVDLSILRNQFEAHLQAAAAEAERALERGGDAG